MNLNDERDYQTIVIDELDRKLPKDVEIKTCAAQMGEKLRAA
jgi:hypothetical protein